jgi:catechol 2,3-dioxygenase-like lactoylglutathione lyase family enzyme
MEVMDEGPSVIRKLQNVYVATTRLDETVRFYRDVLGLRLKFQDAERWAQFDLDGASFAVSTAGEGSATPGAGAVVVFEVDDLETAMSLLRGRGVQPGAVVDMGSHGRHVTVRDPGGNPIQLFQRSR